MRRWLPALLLFAALPAFAQRNWGRCPAIVTLETSEPVYAIGDVVDHDALVKLLAAAKLSDGTQWTGGRAILVVTGNVMRNPKGEALLRALTTSAGSQGGRVIVTLGEQESGEIGDDPFLRCAPYAARVNSWFFAHGGNTRGKTLSMLVPELQNGKAAHDLLVTNVARDETFPTFARVQQYADAVGAKHFVVSGNETRATLSGLVFRLDPKLRSMLRIEGDEAHAVFADGTETTLRP